MTSLRCTAYFSPACQNQIKLLNRLTADYPALIPIDICAAYLNLPAISLRKNILRGEVPGAFAWRSDHIRNHVYIIQTLPFYFWQLHRFTENAGQG